MTQTNLKFNSPSEVLEYLEQEHLSEEEREYYFSMLKQRGGMEGVSYNKEK